MMKYPPKILLFSLLLILLVSCHISFEELISTIKVTQIMLDKTSVELVEGDEVTLIATVLPENASNKAVTWRSDDSSVASVSDEGKIVGLKEGMTTITVTTEDGGFVSSCELKVLPRVISVTQVALDKTSVELVKGDEITDRKSVV